MDGANSGGKKIVFKKRLAATKDDLPDLGFEAEVPVEESAPVDEGLNLLYEGEFFDQFYRPLAVAGGVERLKELAREPLAAVAPPPRLSSVEVEQKNRSQQELAEALAHQIFKLAQQDRERELDVYLSAFNVILGDKTIHESKEILDRANEFFTEHYYTIIRDRGERPEIYHQIVKRVGHESADRIRKIVTGFDVQGTAELLWSLYQGAHADKDSRITDILLDCTEKQLRAVREECILIPYKLLARQIHDILSHNGSEPQLSARRSIGKTEVYEQKKKTAFRARDDMRAIRYLLLGRSIDEVQIINRFYIDFGPVDAHESEINIEAIIRRQLSQADFDRVGSILEGWSPHQEASSIQELVYPRSFGPDIDDVLSDPRDMVERDHMQGIGPFLRRFKKRRAWRGKDSAYYRVLNQFEIVAEHVAAMTPDRFLATNEALHEMFGYELDPTMFPSLTLFDPRRTAMQVHARIPCAGDFFEIVQPLLFLQPHQCLEVQCAYETLFGSLLPQDIEKRIAQVSGKAALAELPALLARYVHGHGRWPLNVDIMARYRGEEPAPYVWQHHYRNLTEDEAAAIALAEMLDEDGGSGSLDRKIKESLFAQTYDQLNRLERAFFDLTDPHMPLLKALEECLTPDAFKSIELLFAGIDAASVVAHIHDDPASAAVMREMAPHHIQTVRSIFEKTHFVALDTFVLQKLTDPSEEEVLVDALSSILTPEVFHARHLFSRLKRDSVVELDALRKNWTGPMPAISAFERAFDRVFPRLRLQLKILAARQVLLPQVFAEFVLCLEGVDPEINQKILECFDAVDIHSLLEILRRNKHDQRIIEETYDLLNPDAQLRRAVKEMKVDLDLINETLLHIEGYSALDVACELYGSIERLSGEELGSVVSDILAVPTKQHPNPRIPADINWMDEMVFQVSLAYQREYRHDFVAACRKKGVADEILEELTGRIYGLEICASARELFSLIKMHKEGAPIPEFAEQRLCSYLESRGARHRDRLVRSYNSFWAHTPGYISLIDDITKFFKDTTVKKKMVAMLLGVGGDNKAGLANPVVLH
jgi:hypothetical protein